MLFSTDPDPQKSKTKCLLLRGKRKNLLPPDNLQLYGVNLPWVESATHLGHELTSEATMDTDARMKRATFISRSTEVRETFQFARPTEVLNAVMLYCCDYYGSMLWDFRGEASNMFFNSMRTCVKLAYHVPRQTKTFLVNHLLARDLVSAREEILSRFTGFVNKLSSSPCREVRVMAALTVHNARTVTGSNVALVEEESGLKVGRASIHHFRTSLVAARPAVPAADVWRLSFLEKLIEDRDNTFLKHEENAETTAWAERREELIRNLCV